MEKFNIEDWYVLDKPFSFGGKYRLYEAFGKKDKALIDKSLKGSDIYSRFLQYKKPRRYSPIYVDNKRELFQCDLIAFTNKELAENNDGFLYLFTTIDVFSKYAWVYKLKNKECKTVMHCFEDILSKCGKKPEKVQTDRGSEFVCKAFKKYFKDQGIHHYVSYSDRKCPVIERFNLTLQQLLYKIMDHQNTLRWIDCVEKAMKIYLNRSHRTISMSPRDAELKKNEKSVRRSLYKYFAKSGLKPQKAKFKIGDTVRVWKYHRKFQRGYDSKFTHEYFKICKILRNLPVVRYKLKDINGEEILGNYFQEELVPYTEPEFHKTIVLDTKGKGRNKMYLVKYEGWDDKYNRWVKEQDTINLEGGEGESAEDGKKGNQNKLNDLPQSEPQRKENEMMDDENEFDEVSINADTFYENLIDQEKDNENDIIMQDFQMGNQNISNRLSHRDGIPQKIKVHVVTDDNVGKILEASDKITQTNNYPMEKPSSSDGIGLETMFDIHDKELTNEILPHKIKVNVVTDDEIGHIINKSGKKLVAYENPRVKKIRVLTAVGDDLDQIQDINHNIKVKKRKAPTLKKVKKVGKNNPLEMGNVFRSSRRGI